MSTTKIKKIEKLTEIGYSHLESKEDRESRTISRIEIIINKINELIDRVNEG